MTRNRFSAKLISLALLAPLMTAACWDDTPDPADLVQGWTPENRSDWYWATQGSRLIPEAWWNALEQPDSTTPFRDMDNLLAYGFIAPPDGSGVDRPIGFAKDIQADTDFVNTGLRWYDGQQGGDDTAETWMGLNCAACHTARVTYQGTDMVIDGGPSLLDFQSFIEGLDDALKATRDDPEKWERFNAAVLDGKDTPENRTMLEDAFGQFLAWQMLTDEMNETPVRYGFGRLDAVGHILNKILMFTGAEAKDGNAANAPVSYPFLWDIWRQERVQWNGVAANSRLNLPGDTLEYGALGRNTGEVMGVFGEVLIKPNTGTADTIKGFQSSVKVNNLMRMEQILQALDAPAWPEAFPPIDTDLAAAGEPLFREHCADCHLLPDMQEEGKPTEVMVPFEKTPREELTDIWMACNAYVYRGPTGPLKGSKDNNGDVMEEIEPVANMLGATVKASLIGAKGDLIAEAVPTFFGVRLRPDVTMAKSPFDPRAGERAECMRAKDVLILGYKARPLDGIWATSPYLHNGSVANLYELLLPADERMTSFTVGNYEFDPEKVGYVTTGGGFELVTRQGARVVEGDSNKGHEYGASGFTEEDRRALVEFMKTL
ncbi:di-heme-cytochrome C peroxidase [Thalassococcus sp. BH17M4-6]|uniref:di-heme-cytochrome C peroxidase n=1 Tax=Thalassococcus sp. BH17M4-6 TaxID=3413148 RepID=UPI003BE4DD28